MKRIIDRIPVTVSWNQSHDKDLAGYKLAIQPYGKPLTAVLAVPGNVTTATLLVPVPRGRSVAVLVKEYDRAGNSPDYTHITSVCSL